MRDGLAAEGGGDVGIGLFFDQMHENGLGLLAGQRGDDAPDMLHDFLAVEVGLWRSRVGGGGPCFIGHGSWQFPAASAACANVCCFFCL